MSLRRDDSVYFRKPRFGVRTCPLVETTVRRLALWSRWSATGCCTRADTAWLASVQAVLGRGCLRCEQRFSRLFGGGGCYVDGREVFARVVRYRSHTRSCDHTWTQVMGLKSNRRPGHKSMGVLDTNQWGCFRVGVIQTWYDSISVMSHVRSEQMCRFPHTRHPMHPKSTGSHWVHSVHVIIGNKNGARSCLQTS
jgi:hypothetical protein